MIFHFGIRHRDPSSDLQLCSNKRSNATIQFHGRYLKEDIMSIAFTVLVAAIMMIPPGTTADGAAATEQEKPEAYYFRIYEQKDIDRIMIYQWEDSVNMSVYFSKEQKGIVGVYFGFKTFADAAKMAQLIHAVKINCFFAYYRGDGYTSKEGNSTLGKVLYFRMEIR